MSLTIIIPTLNAEKDIQACLESIDRILHDALGKNVFVRVEDGGSRDRTVSLAKALGLPGLIVSSQVDSGVYDAMNRGVQAANTQWVYFLGADDRLLPDFHTAMTVLTETANIYYADVEMRSDGRSYDGKFFPLKLVFRNICHQSIFFPRQMLVRSPFDTSLKIHADWAKNIELMSQCSFNYIPYLLCAYEDRSGLSITTKESHFESIKARLFWQHHGWLFAGLSRVAPLLAKLYHYARKKPKLD